ncbi:MAG: aliphatic sulfonate ABC transporter permease SsuC [Cyanobacteriota bacterium]|nr:aliphatic sulfonate ABC transporter permease SsuC [Cyanobacteriota bacterium]
MQSQALLNGRYAQKLLPWLLPITLLVVWQIFSEFGFLPTRILPSPSDVLLTAFQLTQSGELWLNIGISFKRAAIGFLIGGGIGFTLGMVNGLFLPAEQLLDTSVQMIRNIPHLAMIPLVILWFGIGEEARIFLVAIGVLFPIYINTFYGIRTVDPGLIEMGKVYGLQGWALVSQVILPGALPAVLVGLRFALGIMWLTLIVAETIAANSGIGYMAMNAREFLQTDVVVLSIILYALLGKIADVIARVLEENLLKWHPSYSLAKK